jgi:cyclic pyranopterin phosphate synthase
MVDISKKTNVFREATARGEITLKDQTLQLIKENKLEKGDVFNIAKVAGILAAKKTSEIIPLCHPLDLTNVDIKFTIEKNHRVAVEATIKSYGKTGVEMEALTAVSVALLTVWDMTKQYEKDRNGQYPSTFINNIKVLRKVKKTE